MTEYMGSSKSSEIPASIPWRSVVGATVAALIAIVVGGADASAQPSRRVPVDEKNTLQKAAYVERLVTKSVAAKTIESSGDRRAVYKLVTARVLVGKARAALDGGGYKSADADLDAALALVKDETRRLSKVQVNDIRARESYERRLRSARVFLDAYGRVGGGKDRRAAIDAEISRVNDMIGRAEAIAGRGRIEKAAAILDQAYLATRRNIKGLRQGVTLTRTLIFATAEDEYSYEIDRNDSHFMLLDLALRRQPVAGNVMDRIDDLRGSAKRHRSGAESHAAKGAYAAAIDALNKSTEPLLKAIRMTGLFIPG